MERPKLTGRAIMLALVVTLLMVSYASSLRAYLDQRDHLTELRTEIAETEASIAALTREKTRWSDPAYITLQARQKLQFILPGEVGLIVLDENGQPLGNVDELSAPLVETKAGKPPWYDAAWESVLTAGNPPAPAAPEPEPLDRIRAPKVEKDN